MTIAAAGADRLVVEQPKRRAFPGLGLLRSTHGLQRAMLVLGLVLVAGFILVAIFAPLLAPYGFAQTSADGVEFVRQQAPSAQHWFGTSVRGEDVFSRVIYGARTALMVIVLSLVISLLRRRGARPGVRLLRRLAGPRAGAGDGRALRDPVAAAGDRGGDRHCGRAVRHAGRHPVAAVSIMVVFVPQYFRVVRNATVAIKAEPFVESARVIGASTPRILFRHVLSNVTSSLPVIITLNGAEAILTLAGLGFLGFGIEPTKAAEWGYDLNKALSDISNGIWWTAVFPGTAIVLVVLGMTLVGESINEVLDPLLRTRRAANDMTQAPEAPALSYRQLSVTFATDAGTVRAVDEVTFDVKPGEVLAVVGESGSGKSVSSRAAIGLLPDTARVTGTVLLGDRDVAGLSDKQFTALRGKDIAMVFQEPARRWTRCSPSATRSARPSARTATSTESRPGTRRSNCCGWSAARPRAAVRLLPAPVLRRSEAARRHRLRYRLRPGGDHRRRADHRTRCHRAGRDPRTAARLRDGSAAPSC